MGLPEEMAVCYAKAVSLASISMQYETLCCRWHAKLCWRYTVEKRELRVAKRNSLWRLRLPPYRSYSSTDTRLPSV